MKQNELSIRKRLFSKQNIYLALYSVESYISNRELLDKRDKEELNRLKDKFDEKNIEKWIEKVQERLYQLIDESHYLHARIFFKYQWELSEYLNRYICQPEGFDAYGYPSELFKLDMERLGIAAKRKPAKVIDFTKYIDTNRSNNH